MDGDLTIVFYSGSGELFRGVPAISERRGSIILLLFVRAVTGSRGCSGFSG